MERKVLIVDDEKGIRDLFRMVFEKNNIQVVSAENAEEALRLQEKEMVHVMFLDLQLPEMTGIELCKKIKFSEPACICYAVTGYTSIYEINNCREAGFDDYFAKPIKMEKMLIAAEQAFEKIERWKGK